MCLLLKYRLIFLRVLKVFDEPLGESSTERRVKLSAGVSKEGAHLIIYLLSSHKIWQSEGENLGGANRSTKFLQELKFTRIIKIGAFSMGVKIKG